MKSFNPLVTVLMPVYNGEKYLAEAIESVLNQTFADFELLIIDDCSSDNSVEIIQSYNDNRLKLIINEENIGQSSTMNKAIELAEGKYIARLDQDDLSYKNRLQVQLEKISDLNKTILGSWAYAINQKSDIIGCIQHPVKNESILDALSIGSPLSHSSIFADKKELLLLGGYTENFKIAMDWDLWIKAAIKNYYFYNIPEYLIGLRQHTNQASKDKKGKRILNRETLELLNKSKRLIKSKKNLKAYNGWKYYHETRFIFYNNKLFKSLYKFIYSLLNYQSLYEFLKIFVFHKVIKNPKILYNVPIHFTKLPISNK